MSDLALPPHLRGRKHNDWPWPFKGISRGWNAKGPRAKGTQDYLPWPPILVEGKGVSRWETAGGKSIVHIPGLDHVQVKGSDLYGLDWNGVEMNPGNPRFHEPVQIRLTQRTSNVFDVWDESIDKWVQVCDPDSYSPSALQKFSPKGWMRLSPDYYSQWRIIKKRELPMWPETGEDTVIFMRTKYRPDHGDLYYNRSIIASGGLHWE